jgi:uncharacterized coiled-coil DUF342 family protein
MDLIGLIKSALCALASYLELKNKAFYYDIIQKSKNRQKELINEIEELRSKRTNDSNDRADILRSELINERKTLEHLSASYSLSGKG